MTEAEFWHKGNTLVLEIENGNIPMIGDLVSIKTFSIEMSGRVMDKEFVYSPDKTIVKVFLS